MKRNKQKRNKINEVSYADYPVIIEDFFEFSQPYIEKSIDLHVHENSMDAQIYKSVQNALAEQYDAALALKYAQSQSNSYEKFYLADSLAEELRIYARRHWRTWNDSPMKEVLDKRIAAEASGRLAELEEGLEPDYTERLLDLLLTEFVVRRKRRKLIKTRGNRLICYIGEYISSDKDAEERDKLFLLIAAELAANGDAEKFTAENGEYLKALLDGYIGAMEAPAEEEEPEDKAAEPELLAGTEEPAAETTEEAETEYDDLSALYELADEPDEEPPLEETTSGEPVQEEMELRLVPVPYSSFGVLVQQTVAGQAGETAEPAEEPADNGNADGENGNE